MNYLKSTIKNIYQKVIQDQYLQILTEHQVYLIINMVSRRRLSSVGKDPRKLSMSAQQLQQELFTKIQQMGNTSPQRIFKILGVQPSMPLIKDKLKQMQENLSEISDVMQENFGKYEKRINIAIEGLENRNRIQIVRIRSGQLRNKLKGLQQVSRKSKKIAELNIKATNIKKIQKILQQIPNIKKMSLTQLKSISLQSIKSKPTLSSLLCLKGLQQFINHAVSHQLSLVLQKLKQCLLIKFNQTQYQNALKDFIIAQHQTIKYENLLMKIVQNQIRYIENEEKYQIGCVEVDGESEGNSNRWVYGIGEGYVRFLINLHEVFKWHRTNQKQEKWQHLSKGFYGISIQININKITQKIISVMDQCLKDIVLQTLYQSQSPTNHLQLLYIILRLSQICHTFSGIHLISTIKQSTQFTIKKIAKIKQKASHQLQETYKLQQKNSWNRLPVIDTYSHQPLDKCLYQIYRHRESQGYGRVFGVLEHCEELLRKVRVQTGGLCVGIRNEANLWDYPLNKQLQPIIMRELNGSIPVSSSSTTASSSIPQKIKFFQNSQPEPQPPSQSHPSPSPPPQQIPQWQSQTFQIQQTRFPKPQKYQKNKSLVSLKFKPIHIKTSPTLYTVLPFKAIICQYGLTILKYMEIFVRYCFYFPIQPVITGSLENIRLMIQYYIYQIFTGFLSINIKTVFFQKLQNMTTQQQRYHKCRLHYTYPNISVFITKFKQIHKLTQREYADTSPSASSSSIKHSSTISYSSLPNIPLPGSGSLSNSGNIGGSAADALMKENLMVRSRVVALESLLYVVEYYGHVCEIMGITKDKKEGQNGNTNKLKQQPSLYNLHPSLSQLHQHSHNLYLTLYTQLSQLLYTDFVPKLCNMKNTHSLIQSIKWNDSEYPLQQYVQVFAKNCTQFYYKMNSNSKGEVPTHICQRLYGVYWRTQLTTIMKSFITTFKPGKTPSSTTTTPKHKLEHFLDSLYEIVCQTPKQKSYIRIPYEKMKAIFPILMENKWQNAFQLLKLSLSKYEFIYVVEMGLGLISQSCCYLSNEDIQDRKRIIESWIEANLIEKIQDHSAKKKQK